jgi:hypothetical protein
MERNLSALCINYYNNNEDLIKVNTELRRLQSNPIVYTNEVKATTIQRVIDYQVAVSNAQEKIDQLQYIGREIKSEIMDLLDLVGIGSGKKIEVHLKERSILEFWFDKVKFKLLRANQRIGKL